MDITNLLNSVTARYQPEDYPALHSQINAPQQLGHLQGVRLLDATPIFANTLAKYAALLAAGAHLSVSVSPALPHDPQVVADLRSWGVALVTPQTAGTYDVVMDCAGEHADVSARLGYVELTRSGVAAYADCRQPVVIADDGRAKLVENALGTADGWLRAMAHFGHPIDSTSQVVLFGYGKVGRGVALACERLSASLTVVDPLLVTALNPHDDEAVQKALATATSVVSATGQTSGLHPHAAALVASPAVLANLGATDEYGPAVPADRVLNGKAPVNFALEEPTQMPYIDPTMALVNAAADAIAAGSAPSGSHPPEHSIDAGIVSRVCRAGRIGRQVEALFAQLEGSPT